MGYAAYATVPAAPLRDCTITVQESYDQLWFIHFYAVCQSGGDNTKLAEVSVLQTCEVRELPFPSPSELDSSWENYDAAGAPGLRVYRGEPGCQLVVLGRAQLCGVWRPQPCGCVQSSGDLSI